MTRASHLRTKYGITENDYENVLARQNGNCGCCGREARSFTKRLAVDHDHHTGEIRGLLCIHCNRYVIGKHRRPAGVALLTAAARYLTGPYTGLVVPPKKKRKKRSRTKRT